MKETYFYHIDKARYYTPVPFVITSGYRCKKHNKEVGGSDTSSHLYGIASDIRVKDSRERFEILKALIKEGFTRIGIGKDLIHADRDIDKTPHLIWLY